MPFEGRCVVVAVGQLLKPEHLPRSFQYSSDYALNNNKWVLNGGSCIVGPDGSYLLEPQYEGPEIIYFEIDDLDMIYNERMTLDVSGHYQRPDVFEFAVTHRNEGETTK